MEVYKITNLIDGKIYVGKTIMPLSIRWSDHLSAAKNSRNKCYLYNAIRKYGRDNFKIEHICSAYSFADLNFLERFYIKFFKSNDSQIGYNLTAGGEGSAGYIPTEETRLKLSLINKGRVQTSEHIKNRVDARRRNGTLCHTKEDRKKMSESHKGKKLSKESIRKSADARRGKKRSKETRLKISRANLGRKRSEEAKINISIGRLNSPNVRGWHHTEESKRKISETETGKPSKAKGKTFEELYGMDRALAIKNKMRLHRAIWHKKLKYVKEQNFLLDQAFIGTVGGI